MDGKNSKIIIYFYKFLCLKKKIWTKWCSFKWISSTYLILLAVLMNSTITCYKITFPLKCSQSKISRRTRKAPLLKLKKGLFRGKNKQKIPQVPHKRRKIMLNPQVGKMIKTPSRKSTTKVTKLLSFWAWEAYFRRRKNLLTKTFLLCVFR